MDSVDPKRLYSAKKAGELMGIPHHEVIRRIRRGQIRAEKLDWNYIIRGQSIANAMKSEWYQKRISRTA